MSEVNESMDMLASIVEAAQVGMLLFDKQGKLVFANARAGRIFAYSKTELRHLSIHDLVPPRFRDHHLSLEKDFFSRPRPRSMGSGRRLSGLNRRGQEIPLEVGLSPLAIGGEHYVLASVLDISDRLKAERLEKLNRELAHAATHDELTRLPNRRLLMEFAENLRLVAMRNKSRFTMMFIDLDGFKAINDVYGHRAGDLLLCEVATALVSTVRKSDIIGRYGGDEFLMCFAENKSFEYAERKARKLLSAIENISSVQGRAVAIGASIGVISTTNPEEVSVESMIQQADSLMYLAKERKRKIIACDGSDMASTFFE